MSTPDPYAIDQIINVDQLLLDVNGSMDDLNEAMRTQTALALHYGLQHAKSRTQRNKFDNLLKTVEAGLQKQHRKLLQEAAVADAEANGGKPERITADMVAAAVGTDSRMLKLMNKQLEAAEIEHVCRIAYEAFRTRSDMIKGMGMLTREEMRTTSATVSKSASALREDYHNRRAGRQGSGQEVQP